MKTARKRNVLIVIVLAVTILILQQNCTKKSEPNVVLIVLDTLRADHLPFYGYHINTAPFLSELATQSIVFENVFSTASYTAPATASIFTSLYPFQHGVVTGFFTSKQTNIELNRIPGKIKTITEILKENGYKTYGVANNINICREEGFTRGFDKFKRFRYPQEKKMDRKLEKWAAEIKAQKKYFLYIHYNDCHHPYYKRLPWYEKKRNAREDTISRYNSEISYVDNKIKKMYHLFGWDKNTLLIITADHGEEFWEHNKKGHGRTLYSEVIRVPLLIYFPAKARMHKRIKVNVSNMDILPTIRNYLGIESNEVEAGLNLMPLIHGKNKGYKNRYIFSYLLFRDKKGPKVVNRATVHKDWKYIFYEKLQKSHIYRRELYNLKGDPRETLNMTDKNERLANQLFAEFMEFEKKCKKFKQETMKTRLTEKETKELKTLGYVE